MAKKKRKAPSNAATNKSKKAKLSQRLGDSKKQNLKKSKSDSDAPDFAKLIGWTICDPKSLKDSTDEAPQCCICMDDLFDAESQAYADTSAGGESDVPVTLKCSHSYHKSCIVECCKQTGNSKFVSCCVCQATYGVRTGPMPRGTLSITHTNHSISSSKASVGTTIRGSGSEVDVAAQV